MHILHVYTCFIIEFMIHIDPHWNFSWQEFAQCDFIVSDPVVSYRETVTEESNQSCSLAEMGVRYPIT